MCVRVLINPTVTAMNLQRYAYAVLAGFFTLTAPFTASAAVLEYEFKASVVGMFEYSAESGIVVVPTSSFAGDLISIGDGVTGTFSYNTDGVLSPYYQPPQPALGSYLVYLLDPALAKMSFTVDGRSVGFRSGLFSSLLILGNGVAELASWDTFNIGFSTDYNPVMFQDAGIALYDTTGTTFSTGSIPEYLDFSAFYVKGLSAGWLRQSDGNQLQMRADITSIELVPSTVDLPDTMVLLLLGLGAVLRQGARSEKPPRWQY